MCLIAYANRDRSQIPNVHLSRAHAINRDAWGIMFPDLATQRLTIIKDCTDHDSFRKSWATVPFKTPVAVHFRYKTIGAKSLENAHPIPVLNFDEHGIDLAMMHNGTLHIRGDKDASDTTVLVRDILRPILADDPSLIESESWRFMLARMISANDSDDNKLLFMRGDGTTWIVNEHQGTTLNKVWYSNEYSIEAWTPYKTGGKVYDSWEDWMYGDHNSRYVSPKGKGSWRWNKKKNNWLWVESSNPAASVVPLPNPSDKIPVVLSNSSHDGKDVQSETKPKTMYEQAAEVVRKVIARESDQYPLRACTCSDERGSTYQCRCPAPVGYVQCFEDSEMGDDNDNYSEGGYMYSEDGLEDTINGIPVDDLRVADLPNCTSVALRALCEEHPDLAADLLLECVQF